jgi:hypothetical protein
MLPEFDMALKDLTPCEAKLREAEGSFGSGAAMWARGDKMSAVSSWAVGMNLLSKGVKGCGLEQQLGWIEQEANVLGLGNLSVVHEVTTLMVHGSDFYQELYDALVDVQCHDYRSAGQKLVSVMNHLATWTTGHLCTDPMCYIVNGIFQYLDGLGQDVQKCNVDFHTAWYKFEDGFQSLSGHRSFFSGFDSSTYNITQGVNDMGRALQAVASSVSDCHMPELQGVIAVLANKLLGAPQLTWIETFLKILIDGVSIETELANACKDYVRHDWAGFGYNLMKLEKTLLKPERIRKSRVIDIYV